MTSEGPKRLLVLGKITDILDAFTLQRPVLGLGEIQQATGIPTSRVQRLVSSMVAEGLLDRVGDRVRIGIRMAYWAGAAARGVDLLELAGPLLRELRDTTGETASLFRAEGRHRVCVAVAETRHALRREMHVGKVIPLHTGSAGRVLLAWAPELAAALVKDLGTRYENEIVDAARLLVDIPPDPGAESGFARLLADAVLHAPGFTLRGGTNEVLRGIVARGMGLR